MKFLNRYKTFESDEWVETEDYKLINDVLQEIKDEYPITCVDSHQQFREFISEGELPFQNQRGIFLHFSPIFTSASKTEISCYSLEFYLHLCQWYGDQSLSSFLLDVKDIRNRLVDMGYMVSPISTLLFLIYEPR